MLSNIVAVDLDKELSVYSDLSGLVYTRYADDLTFSTKDDLPKSLSIGKICHSVIRAIRKNGFRENPKKTRVAGPGSKKMVLGLLVDGFSPRLSKEMYKRIDRHLHAVQKYGWIDVAKHEKFDSVFGFYNHLMGLIAFVKDVDSRRWHEFQERYKKLPELSSK